MSVETVPFRCMLASGLHARPASMLADALIGLDARVTLRSPKGTCDATSVLGVLGLDIELHDVCECVCDGPDAERAASAVRRLIEGAWAQSEASAAQAQTVSTTRARRLPVSLARLNVAHAWGVGAVCGVGVGSVVVLAGVGRPSGPREASEDATVATARALRAMDETARELELLARDARGELERGLRVAHARMAIDPALRSAVEARTRGGASPAHAVYEASIEAKDHLAGAKSAMIRDRGIDVMDVCGRVLARLGEQPARAAIDPSVSSVVVVAEGLAASDLLALHESAGSRLAALMLRGVGETAHTVIVARSLGIPTLLDVQDDASVLREKVRVIVDGDRGVVLACVPAAAVWYQRRALARAATRSSLGHRCVTRDGTRVEIAVNAAGEDDVSRGMDRGAEACGLVRTELLFMARDVPPGEDEQAQLYERIVRAANGARVIFRVLDIGGDKPAAFLSMSREDNPFLGVRGVRLLRVHEPVLRTQIRAMLRASTHGRAWIMAPMVSTPEEMAWFAGVVREEQASMRAASIAMHEDVRVGAMVEVPGLVWCLREVCEHAQFLSVGSNDLSQYIMAADRTNPGVAGLASWRQPAIVRALSMIAREARTTGTWLGMCGEMAGDVSATAFLVGLGFHELSMACGSIERVRERVAMLDAGACAALSSRAVACASCDELEGVLASITGVATTEEDVIDHRAIVATCDATDKHEAMRAAVDALAASGRALDGDLIESDAWAREATYATSLGFGFAVPHCTTSGVRCPSLAVVRLRDGVRWSDDRDDVTVPVRVVLLLAVPAGMQEGSHMRIFAQLARMIVHASFRESVLGASNAQELEHVLRASLSLPPAQRAQGASI